MMMEIERYWTNEPFTSVVISHEDGEYVYHAEEPMLTPAECALLERIDDDLRDVLLIQDVPEGTKKEEFLEKKVEGLIRGYRIKVDRESIDRILYYMRRDYTGYGKIDALLKDDFIEDMSCNGANSPIFLYHKKYQNIKTNISFEEMELNAFVSALAQRCGKHLSIGRPMLNATMPDGSRLQATIGREISPMGSSFVIRKFGEYPFTPVDLVKFGTFSPEMLACLWLAIENNKSVIIVGGTATGKTSTLNAMLFFIPPIAKIITIEDTRELVLYHENWIASVTRDSSMDGGQSIGMYELLRQAYRQRPECIIVGEVRGEEALTLFQAMSSGHTCCCTMHANNVQEAVNRLENEPINVPSVMLQALDMMIVQSFASVEGMLIRRVKTMVEFMGMDPRTGNIKINEIFRWASTEDKFERAGDSYILKEIMEEKGWNIEDLDKELEKREAVIRYMAEEGTDYVEVARMMKIYFEDSDSVLEDVRKV